MIGGDYNNQIFKQLEEVMKKCDDLSQEIKQERKEFKKEKAILNQKIQNLENKVEKLETENKKLKDDNDRLKKQLNNDSNNSSKPPSSDIKKNIPNNREKRNKKVGGQKGHKGHSLTKKSVEEKIKNGEFKHEVINVGKIPKEFQTDVQYGNELKTLCAILNTEGVVAFERLANIIRSITHNTIGLQKSTIINFMLELNKKSSNIIENIRTKILNSELLYTDGTSGRCNGKNIYVRNYSTKELTYFVPTKGKGKKYIEETNILNRYTGSLVHDHETVIYNYGNQHIECNVHVARYLKGCYENTKNKWAHKMRSLLCSLNEYRKKLINKGIKKLELEQIERYSKRYDEIIEEGYRENKKVKSKYIRQEEQRLINRLKKYKENHIIFLYDFSVPFDNNLSERDLRHVKIKQKVSGYFNSSKGIENYLNAKSIIGTLKKQGRNFYREIFNIYEGIPVEI